MFKGYFAFFLLCLTLFSEAHTPPQKKTYEIRPMGA